MKIAHIVCAFPPYKGGMGNSAYQFAKILFKKGYDITTFTPDYVLRPCHKSPKGCGKVIELKPFLKYGKGAFLPQFFWHLRKFDVVYLHYPFFGTDIIVWLFKIFNPKKKLIIHYHMDVSGLSLLTTILSWPAKIIRNSLFKNANIVTYASLDYIRNSEIAKIYNKYPEKFIEIPFGIDTEKFTPRKKGTKNHLNLLFVGGLDKAHYFKGVNILLEAVAKLQIADYQLLIVGDGDLKLQYEKQAQKLGINSKIKFLGNVANDKLVEIYRQADLFILPSINKNEAFGLVLLEAMASGVPVIASNLPGVRNVFQNNIQGLLFEPSNAIDLKEKMENILNNEERRKKMSQAAQKLVLEKYSLKKVGEKLKNIFVNL